MTWRAGVQFLPVHEPIEKVAFWRAAAREQATFYRSLASRFQLGACEAVREMPTVVNLMSVVVFRKCPHAQSAYPPLADRVPVALKSVYDKLQNIEPVVSAERVRTFARG